MRKTWRANTTASVLERLDQAGAITLGRLNMAEWAFGPTGHNVHTGDCANPWDTARITGGSSSGSGSAVAARLVYGALGSDTGGSVRLPAAFCGLVGVKPTQGRVPRDGAMPLSFSLDNIGPLCRTAEDAAIMLGAIAGATSKDSTCSNRRVPDYRAALEAPLAGRRVGVILSGDLASGLTPVVAEAVEAAARVLGDEGAIISQAPAYDFSRLGALANLLMKSEAATIHGPMLREHPDGYSPQVRSRIEAGFFLPATRYLEAASIRGGIAREFIELMLASNDVLLAPMILSPAPTRATTNEQDPAQVPKLLAQITQCSRPVNYLGLPAVSVPCGFVEGLPVAFQLVGRPFDESTLLSIAHRYQITTEFYKQQPAP